MRRISIAGVVVLLSLAVSIPVQSQNTTQMMQGTQVRLVLLNSLSSSVAREGDPFTAVVAEPVYLGDQLILPAGVKVHGEVGPVLRPKRFAMFRGQAAMNLYIRSIEFEHREIPAAMSILSIHETSAGGTGKKRGDLKTEEGVLVQARRDVKGDIKTAGLATAGGTVVGAVFSNVMRGLVIGVAGSTAYILARKGKEVELPAQTGLLVRLDQTVTLPAMTPAALSQSSGQP